jgi:Leucine-rich repeat (LRR) protein
VTVLKDLLVNTSCRVKEKKVNWSKLRLSTIDESWLFHIKSWVQFLNLSHNTLTSLPECLIDLKMVVSLNLSKNKLKVVPMELFSMISLRDLNLSGNGIAELPEIPQWRPVLKTLNVSDNNLSSLPDGIGRSYMETLNLSRNHFTRVPLAVCEIISLRDLDLSDNREINHLPDEMGKLRNLFNISLKNLDQVRWMVPATHAKIQHFVAS